MDYNKVYLFVRISIYRKKLRPLIDLIFSIIVFFPLLPIIFIIGTVFRLIIPYSQVVFFCALEHIIKKSLDRAYWFRENKFNFYFYSFEQSKIKGEKYVGKNMKKISNYIFIDFIIFFIMVLNFYPKYIEFYLTSSSSNLLRQLYYLFIARVFGIFSVIILRGETHPNGDYYNRSRFWRWNLKICLELTNKIYYRELLNTVDFTKYPEKCVFDHNSIPINEFKGKQYNKTILFLNGFKQFRRVDLLAKAVKTVVSKHPNAHFIFAGARSDREKKIVINILAQENMLEFAEVLGWIEDPNIFYEKSSIFVLLADENLIFCNYSLIEAMERGLVPVLSDVSDANRFVKSGYNGLLVKQDYKELAKGIIYLLNNFNLMANMGKNARNKIISDYDNEERMERLLNDINGYYIN